MTNALFPAAKEGFLVGAIDWDTAVFKVALVRAYTYDATDVTVADVTAGGGVLAATSGALASKTFTGGVVDAADVTFTAVTANAAAHGLLLFQASAVAGGADVAAASQRVVAWLDTGTLLPVAPNGGDVTVAWDSGANRIFAL
jgi:predicted RNA methylase